MNNKIKTTEKWNHIYSQKNTNSMAAMFRPNNRCKKIAWSILGTPSNIAEKKTAIEKKIDKKILYDNTQRVR